MRFDETRRTHELFSRAARLADVIEQGYRHGLFSRKELEALAAADTGKMAEEVLQRLHGDAGGSREQEISIARAFVARIQETCWRLLQEEHRSKHLTRAERLRLLQHLSDALGDLNDPALIEELGYGRLVPFVKKGAALAAGIAWHRLSRKAAREQQEALAAQAAVAIASALGAPGPDRTGQEGGGGNREQGPAPSG